RQGMKFFVAKVNLGEQKRLGFAYLRPLQVAYDSPKFMLPLRLGMVNADGPQELFVFAITKNGRVETTNYRTVKLPEGMDIPEDLVFQQTADQTNFQARYVLRHPWKGDTSCERYAEYRRTVRERRAKEAETLASLTGWDLTSIRRKMGGGWSEEDNPPAWWE